MLIRSPNALISSFQTFNQRFGGKPKSVDKPKTGKLTHIHFTAHSMFRGWLYTQTVGVGYAARMAWDVFRPGSKLPKIRALSEVDSHSQLHLLRESEEPTEDGYLLGFSFTEMAIAWAACCVQYRFGLSALRR